MIEDDTSSGIPLPHPDNPARADIVRVRNALTALDTRLVTAGEAVETLEDAIEAEELARQQAVAEEENARIDADAAEAQARTALGDALTTAIAEIPTFDPAIVYTKTQVDALIADVLGDEVTTTISTPVAAVDFTIGADHRFIHLMWDDVSHDSGSSATLQVSYSTDGGSTWSATFYDAPISAVANTVSLTGGLLFWMMSDETGMILAGQPAGDVTTTGGATSQVIVTDPSARINRLRVKWSSGSFDAGVVRCRRSK